MRDILLIVFTWVHLLSAVVWVGGIFFILFILLPVAKKTLEQPGKLIGAIGNKFVPLANISILLIIMSGIFMGLSSHSFPGLVSLDSLWSRTMLIKVLTALTMASIHFYRGLVLTPTITKLTAEGGHSGQIGKLQKLSLNLVRTNLIPGLTVLLLTGMLYTYRA